MFTSELEGEPTEHFVEGVLAILLFVDATETPGGLLGENRSSPLDCWVSPYR